MKQRTIQMLYSYWNEVRAGRLAPLRLEIEPSRIAGILSETFMLEQVDAETYQYRLAGTRLCEMFGSELRGQNFLDGWSEPDRAVIERQLATVCDRGAVVVLTMEGSAGTNQRVELEVILLPLIHAGTRIARVIGAMSASSAPHWLHGEHLSSRRLLRHDVIWPDGRPHSLVERSSRQAPFTPRIVAGRLVTSNERRFRVLEGGRVDDKFGKH
jgi:hypothetical protein